MLNLEVQMFSIPKVQYDAKLFMLVSQLQLEVIHVLATFMDCVRDFDEKNVTCCWL